LLLSASKQFPNGLANSSGLVGKNLMLNSGGISLGVFDEQLNDYKGFAVSRILHDFYELDPQKVGFYGGGGLAARFDMTPINFAAGGGLLPTLRAGAKNSRTPSPTISRAPSKSFLMARHCRKKTTAFPSIPTSKTPGDSPLFASRIRIIPTTSNSPNGSMNTVYRFSILPVPNRSGLIPLKSNSS